MLSLKQLCVEELYKQLHQGNKKVIEGIQKHFPTELLPHFRGFQSLHQRMCESYPKTLTSRQLVELIKSLKFQKDFERLSVELNHQFNFSHSELDDELMIHLAKNYPNIISLDLSYTKITPACIEALRSFQNLQKITYRNHEIDQTLLDGFVKLSHLSSLSISADEMPRDHFDIELEEDDTVPEIHFGAFSCQNKLQHLNIDCQKVHMPSLALMITNSCGLTNLSLRTFSCFTMPVMKSINHLKRLTHLRLHHVPFIGDLFLKPQPSLLSLSLDCIEEGQLECTPIFSQIKKNLTNLIHFSAQQYYFGKEDANKLFLLKQLTHCDIRESIIFNKLSKEELKQFPAQFIEINAKHQHFASPSHPAVKKLFTNEFGKRLLKFTNIVELETCVIPRKAALATFLLNNPIRSFFIDGSHDNVRKKELAPNLEALQLLLDGTEHLRELHIDGMQFNPKAFFDLLAIYKGPLKILALTNLFPRMNLKAIEQIILPPYLESFSLEMVMENALQSKFHLFFTNPHFHLQEMTFKCHSKLVWDKIGLAIINARKNMPRLEAIHFNDQTFWVK